MRPVASLLVASLVAGSALALTGCADVYVPRGPNVAVTFGSGGPKTFKDGHPVESLEDAVRESPRAREEAETASSQGTAASVLGVVGTVGAGVGGAMIGADAGHTANNGESFPSGLGIAGIAVAIGSLGIAIASGALRSSSQTHYFNAVNIYNDERTPRAPFVPYPTPYGAPVPAPGYRPLPSFPGQAPPSATPPPNAPVPPPGFAPSPPPGAPGGAVAPLPPPLPPRGPAAAGIAARSARALIPGEARPGRRRPWTERSAGPRRAG